MWRGGGDGERERERERERDLDTYNIHTSPEGRTTLLNHPHTESPPRLFLRPIRTHSAGASLPFVQFPRKRATRRHDNRARLAAELIDSSHFSSRLSRPSGSREVKVQWWWWGWWWGLGGWAVEGLEGIGRRGRERGVGVGWWWMSVSTGLKAPSFSQVRPGRNERERGGIMLYYTRINI